MLLRRLSKRHPGAQIAAMKGVFRSSRITWLSMFLALGLSSSLLDQAMAQEAVGGLLVTPTRVVFDGRNRSAVVSLLNQGDTPTTYRISFTNVRMMEDGRFEKVVDRRADEQFAEDFLRYSPRQVTLEPGQSQTIRLLLRKPSDLGVGEYRSHLFIRGLPPEGAAEDIEAPVEGGQIEIRLVPSFGISIPIIVRHGELDAEASISDVLLERSQDNPAEPVVAFRLNRDGSRPVYGDISITHRAVDGNEVELGRRQGIAVYTPNTSRLMRFRLPLQDGVRLSGGSLYIAYRERSDQSSAILAEAELTVP